MKTAGNNTWEELGRREAMIRNEYAKKRIALKPGEGLALALEESNALAANLKSTKSASDAAVQEAVQALPDKRGYRHPTGARTKFRNNLVRARGRGTETLRSSDQRRVGRYVCT